MLRTWPCKVVEVWSGHFLHSALASAPPERASQESLVALHPVARCCPWMLQAGRVRPSALCSRPAFSSELLRKSPRAWVGTAFTSARYQAAAPAAAAEEAHAPAMASRQLLSVAPM
jgi:hypothetical protein